MHAPPPACSALTCTHTPPPLLLLQAEAPDMYWEAIKALDRGEPLPLPKPHPKFTLQVRVNTWLVMVMMAWSEWPRTFHQPY